MNWLSYYLALLPLVQLSNISTKPVKVLKAQNRDGSPPSFKGGQKRGLDDSPQQQHVIREYKRLKRGGTFIEQLLQNGITLMYDITDLTAEFLDYRKQCPLTKNAKRHAEKVIELEAEIENALAEYQDCNDGEKAEKLQVLQDLADQVTAALIGMQTELSHQTGEEEDGEEE